MYRNSHFPLFLPMKIWKDYLQVLYKNWSSFLNFLDWKTALKIAFIAELFFNIEIVFFTELVLRSNYAFY